MSARPSDSAHKHRQSINHLDFAYFRAKFTHRHLLLATTSPYVPLPTRCTRAHTHKNGCCTKLFQIIYTRSGDENCTFNYFGFEYDASTKRHSLDALHFNLPSSYSHTYIYRQMRCAALILCVRLCACVCSVYHVAHVAH